MLGSNLLLPSREGHRSGRYLPRLLSLRRQARAPGSVGPSTSASELPGNLCACDIYRTRGDKGKRLTALQFERATVKVVFKPYPLAMQTGQVGADQIWAAKMSIKEIGGGLEVSEQKFEIELYLT